MTDNCNAAYFPARLNWMFKYNLHKHGVKKIKKNTKLTNDKLCAFMCDRIVNDKGRFYFL